MAVVVGRMQTALRELGSRIPVPQPAETVAASSLKAARAASRQTEKRADPASLEQTHWNRKRAARKLQISHKSLLSKVKQSLRRRSLLRGYRENEQ